MLSDTVAHLRAVEGLTDLPSAEIEAIAATCRWHRHPRGALIVGQEDASRTVHMITEGSVRVAFFAEDGTEVGFRDLRAGQLFGEIAAIDGRPRSATATALTDCWLASLAPEAFRNLLRQHPVFADIVLQRLAGLVRALSDRVVEFTTLTVANRIHAELLRLARDNMMGDHACIDPAPPHALIASRISTHREAVSRELARLMRQGILKKNGRALLVSDVAALERLVHEPL